MTTIPSSTIETSSEAQHRLMEDLGRLDETVHQNAETTLTALRTCLGRTYTHLCQHFRLKEYDGFLDDLQEREPRFGRIAQELFAEHRQLRQSLDSLHGEAVVAVRVDDALRGKVRQWIAALRRHETREDDLIQDAVDLDIAGQD